MKIIGGKFRGRNLITPSTVDIRPTTGRLRESIFSAVDHRIGGFHGRRVADIFSGTGALGLEALSRGATSATWVEKHSLGLSILKENISLLEVEELAKILRVDARNLPGSDKPFDVIFMDPPYGRALAGPCMRSLLEKNWVGETSLLVLEVDKNDEVEVPEGLEIVKTLKQGFRRVYFIEKSA
ncbi:MAG: 16S rRNA (guanine(966)-N(2))-methyltransferase RsmD [Sphingomonadales bacterium]